MNEFRIRSTGEVVTEDQFRALHENVSFPAVLDKDTLAEYDADPILPAPAPTVTAHQRAVRNGVTIDGLGNFVWAWTVTDWTAEEIAAELAAARARVLQLARDLRTPIMSRLDGLQASNVTSALLNPEAADTYKANAQAIETAKVGLRNITLTDLSAATTEPQMKYLILQAYKAIAAGTPTAVQMAFAGLDI